MNLELYYSEEADLISITPEQASSFAKDIAGDLNPIHDPDARRFCVPGDLLFALVLHRFGLYQRMTFQFHRMLGRDTPILFSDEGENKICVKDRAGKVYLEAIYDGDCTRDALAINDFTHRYVSFSGLNFPHYLKPLMEAHGVMFNPQRPLVIYDRMDYSLERLDVANMELEFSGSNLLVDGKRADADLEFVMRKDGTQLGVGSKRLIISGVRPYDPAIMEAVVEEFNRLKAAYQSVP